MKGRLFVHTKEFDKQWDKINLSDNDLAELQDYLSKNPKAAPVIQGTGGLRKIRFGIDNKGKSGGIRVIYVDFDKYEIIFLVYAYAKNESDDLSQAAKAKFKALIEVIERGLKGDS